MTISLIFGALTSSDARLFVIFSTIQLCFYGVGRLWVAEKARLNGVAPNSSSEVRARAWLLSALVSTILSIAGFVKGIEALSAFGYGGLVGFAQWAMSSGSIENALIIYFMAFLVLDTGIGVIDYRETLRWDTTWLHHITYLIFTIYLVRINATNSFMSYCICEIPTLILALGNIHPKLRHDKLFGYTFAATRLGYFFILSFIFWAATSQALIPFTISGFLIPVAFLHISWFKAWIAGQTRRAARRDVITTSTFSSVSTNSSSSSSPLHNNNTITTPIDTAIRPRIGSVNIIEIHAQQQQQQQQQHNSSSPLILPPEEKVHAPPPHRARIGSGSGLNSGGGIGVVGVGTVGRSSILINSNNLVGSGGEGGGSSGRSPLGGNMRNNKERNA